MDINLPPFYVGQRVVQLVDGSRGQSKKGDVHTVLGIKLLSQWCIDIGQKEGDRTIWCWHYCFAPIQENFQSISLEKILEEETKLISVN